MPFNKKEGIKNWNKEVKNYEKNSDSRAFQSTKSLLKVVVRKTSNKKLKNSIYKQDDRCGNITSKTKRLFCEK